MPDRPLIFISHRHADAAIAGRVATFLRERTGNQVDIYLTSDSGFEGPQVGRDLTDQLKDALGRSDIVLLVFTAEFEDWSWCMYECGIATDPRDQRKTEVIVLQCGATAPKPFGNQLRVDVRDLNSIVGFLKPLLTSTALFHDCAAPLTGFTEESPELERFAEEFRETLIPLMPAMESQYRCAAPFVRLELGSATLDELRAAAKAHDADKAIELVRSTAVVVAHEHAEGAFGFQVDELTGLDRIASQWEEEHQGPTRWLASLVEQIATISSGRHPTVKWAPYSVEPGRAVIPFVAASHSRPASDSVQFDTYFVPMSPRPIGVTERMIPLEAMYHKNLSETPADCIALPGLRAEMKEYGRSRVPVLDKGDKPSFVVHGSVIAEYISDAATSGRNVDTLTLCDLLNASDYTRLLADSFAVVGPEANLEDASRALLAIEHCQDIYVTHDGTRDGQVLGWLTNTMFVDLA